MDVKCHFIPDLFFIFEYVYLIPKVFCGSCKTSVEVLVDGVSSVLIIPYFVSLYVVLKFLHYLKKFFIWAILYTFSFVCPHLHPCWCNWVLPCWFPWNSKLGSALELSYPSAPCYWCIDCAAHYAYFCSFNFFVIVMVILLLSHGWLALHCFVNKMTCNMGII